MAYIYLLTYTHSQKRTKKKIIKNSLYNVWISTRIIILYARALVYNKTKFPFRLLRVHSESKRFTYVFKSKIFITTYYTKCYTSYYYCSFAVFLIVSADVIRQRWRWWRGFFSQNYIFWTRDEWTFWV